MYSYKYIIHDFFYRNLIIFIRIYLILHYITAKCIETDLSPEFKCSHTLRQLCQWGFLWWYIPQNVATFSSRVTLPSTNCPKVTFFPSRFCSDRGYSELSLSHIVQNLEHCIPDNKIGSTRAYMNAMLPHNFPTCVCWSS